MDKFIDYYNKKENFEDKFSKEKLIELLAEKCTENTRLKTIIGYTHKMCMCERFTTMGFDYHEKHPRRKEVNGGNRPLTPRDYIESSCGFEWKKDHSKSITFSKI